MLERNRSSLTRRDFARGLGATMIFAPSLARAEVTEPVRRNVSSFRTHAWQDHFDTLGVGLVISDTASKMLQHWTADGEMRLYPTSVPLSEELTRL
ncbi:MAG: L,D-transpeptidase ErfK/SrfK, partial [Paracoccaceae bacterium]